jgi:hypothetical protein
MRVCGGGEEAGAVNKDILHDLQAKKEEAYCR